VDGMTMDELIKHMTDRFLGWKLPEDFAPDAGIKFSTTFPPSSPAWPIGTNLFTADQVKQMFEHCLEAAPQATGVDEMTTHIEIGDTVVVCFNGAQITLCYYAIVLSVPLGVGDPWVFQDTQTGFLHYVSEGCTVSKRVEPQATGEKS